MNRALTLIPSSTTRYLFSRHFHDSTTTATGLYGFPLLKTANGFRRFVDEAIERSNELVSYISQLPPSQEIIRAMDEISNTVCAVVDSAEFCRNTHPDREFVEEANKAAMRIYDHLHYLNTNCSLYDAVKKAEEKGCLQTEEAKLAAHTLRVDFEKGGIHLSADKMARVNQLNTNIAQLGRQFNENIMTDPGSIDVYPASRIPKHMHHQCKPIYRSVPFASEDSVRTTDKLKEKGFRIMTDCSTLSSILKWTPDAEVRKQAYMRGFSTPHANLAVLDDLISTRHELAEIVGCKSYAEFVTRPNLAASPYVVTSFLDDLSKTIRYKVDEEFKVIRDFKRQLCNDTSAKLEPWDEAYITGMMKSSAYDLNSCVIGSYFSLPQCLKGLKILVESLFGATFHELPFTPGESWHPDVMKLSLHHPQEGDLGFLYLDLYSRKGKYPGCAHFAIRGGCRISETEYQLPIVALVCNFSPSPGLSSSKLSHFEVETLFHEFGHALHSLLSRTDYQHFSGTRVVLDLAETPSNLFEYYAWDYRFLKTFAKHCTTGDTIPQKLAEAMNDAKNMFAATELQRQIFFAMTDITLFGELPATPMDTTQIVADLRRKYTCWDHVEGTHWHTRFNHFVTYGAGYYSYLYAKCFSSTIWQKICHDDPLSASTGTVIRTKFLQHGGAKNPASLLKDVAGPGILKSFGDGIIPDTSSICKELGLE